MWVRAEKKDGEEDKRKERTVLRAQHCAKERESKWSRVERKGHERVQVLNSDLMSAHLVCAVRDGSLPFCALVCLCFFHLSFQSLRDSSHSVTMVTGDALLTAIYVAGEVGITRADMTHVLTLQQADSGKVCA